MDSTTDEIQSIVHGMEVYFRTFALADHISLHRNDIEWISPKPGTPGPSLVYKVALEEKTVKARLEELVPNIQAGIVPSLVISPLHLQILLLLFCDRIQRQG
jgi:hypothetical protein